MLYANCQMPGVVANAMWLMALHVSCGTCGDMADVMAEVIRADAM